MHLHSYPFLCHFLHPVKYNALLSRFLRLRCHHLTIRNDRAPPNVASILRLKKLGRKATPLFVKPNSPLHLTEPIWLPSTDALSHRITDPTDPRLASSSTHDRADGGKITSRTMNYDKAYGVRRLSV